MVSELEGEGWEDSCLPMAEGLRGRDQMGAVREVKEGASEEQGACPLLARMALSAVPPRIALTRSWEPLSFFAEARIDAMSVLMGASTTCFRSQLRSQATSCIVLLGRSIQLDSGTRAVR